MVGVSSTLRRARTAVPPAGATRRSTDHDADRHDRIDIARHAAAAQPQRNAGLLAATPLLGAAHRVARAAVPPRPGGRSARPADGAALAALEKTAAAIAIRSLASLAKAGDIDHLGGGLELIPALLMTLGFVDYDARHFTIEHGHTSIGYYAALAALGFLPEPRVVDAFRRSLDIAGHVSWVPGGTELSSGRLGAIVPVAVGQALGLQGAQGPRRRGHLPLRRRRLGVGPGAERASSPPACTARRSCS